MMAYRIFFIVLLTFLYGCQPKSKTAQRTALETTDIQFTKEGELTFVDSLANKRLQLDIEVAQSEYDQQTGLMYRKTMEANQGMLFVYPDQRPRPNFYMKNTYIALDLIYLNSNEEVVDIHENAKPLDERSLPSDEPAQYVLEVNAGFVQKHHIVRGDKVQIKIFNQEH